MKSENIIFVGAGREIDSYFAELAYRLVRTAEEMKAVLKESGRKLWIGRDTSVLRDGLLGTSAPLRDFDRLLMLEPIGSLRAEFLRAYFGKVVSPDAGTFVPHEVLAEILAEEFPGDYLICAIYDADDEAIILHRGNLDTIVVPMGWFERPSGIVADPGDLQILDYGQTLRLGGFEAATDAILYSFDREFRRRMRKLRWENDNSFGASLRRLRLERGFNQDEFDGVTARTVRRIESGEVSRPHARTLKILANHLDVEPDEIGEW